MPPLEGPRIIDVGIPGFGAKPALWRRSWRDKILPALANFKPDLIFVCAGGAEHGRKRGAGLWGSLCWRCLSPRHLL